MKRHLLAAALLSAAALLLPSAVTTASAGTGGLTCAPDPYEADSATAPAPLAVGTVLTRAICQAPNPFPRTEAGQDFDYSAFTAAGGTAYTIEGVNLGTANQSDQFGNGGLRVGVVRLNADGSTGSVEYDGSRDGKRAITTVLAAGRYAVIAYNGNNQVYPDNTLDIATIQGAAGSYGIKVTASAPPPSVATLSISPSTVNGGKSATGVYTLTAPAPAGGMYIFTDSTDRFVVNPETTFAPAGATSVSFAITTKKISQTLSYTVSVRAQTGPARSAVLTVRK